MADAGSVSKAAASLNVSQPSLAAQLRRVEPAVGGDLLERGIRGVVPTTLGKHILGRARVVLADTDNLVTSSSKCVGSGGPLQLGSVTAVIADHPLAGRSAVRLIDLAEATWLMPPGGKRDGNLAAQRAAYEQVG